MKNNKIISEGLKYHLDYEIPLTENVYRPLSENFFKLINEVRELYKNGMIDLNEDEIDIVKSDMGETVTLSDGSVIYLDVPFIEENLNEAEYKGRKVQ
jgi:hypothetical protein